MEEIDLSQKVRIHKHNYAGEFGNVVIDPALTLLKELVANPTAFSLKERMSIIRACCAAYKNLGRYEVLGYSITEQLDSVRDDIVPSIKDNHSFFKSLIKDVRNFKDPFVSKVIQWADNDIDDIVGKLNNIQYDDKGELKPISAYKFIEEAFKEEVDACSRKGQDTFVYELVGRDFQDIEVLVDSDGFRMCVIHNIIENIKKHAFPSSHKDWTATSKADPNPALKDIAGKRTALIGGIIAGIEFPIWQLLGKKNVATMRNSQNKYHQENLVKVVFRKEPENAEFLNIVIENNGKAFHGDVDEVFKRGVRGADSHGEGLGLFSAADYLTDPRIGGSIKMESTPEEEFTVRFIIKLPIYGKQSI